MAEQTLGQMVVKLSLDSSAYGSGLAAAKKATTGAMAEMKASMKIAAATGNQMSVLGAKQAGLTKQVQAQAMKLREAQEAYNKSFTNGVASKSTARYAKDINTAAGNMAQFQAQMVKTAGQQAMLRTRTTGVTGAIQKMSTTIGKGSAVLRDFGGKATMGLTLPIVAGFAAATKQAMQFQNQMVVIKNLLTTSGESGAEATKQVSTMQKDAVNMSDKYGVSVNKISKGYEDLVRRGYSGSQAIGAMKSELQGALASGDDFNDVVKVSASTMEAFGLRTTKSGAQIQSTSKIAATTKKTVNELAYAADMTATDFQGMGLSMQYVGSTAHTAGFGVAETSAALGVLSNNGLTAQKAGTGLRKVIVSMTAAVGAIGSKNSILDKLGIKKNELVDSNGQLKNLDTIFTVLNKHTQGMSKTEKGIVFNKLFGTTGQAAGMILSQNANQLGKLTAQVQKAGNSNYIGQLSQKNLASAQNQMRVFEETIKNLGMVLAADVLPSITPLMGDVAKLAQNFSNLGPSMRKAIVTFLAITAAVGPFSSGLGIMGGAMSKTGKGLVTMIGNVRKWKDETSAAKNAMDIGNTALDTFQSKTQTTSKATKELGDSTKTIGTGLKDAGNAAADAGTALSGVGAATKEAGSGAREAAGATKAVSTATKEAGNAAKSSGGLWSRLGGLFRSTGSEAGAAASDIAATGSSMDVGIESGVGLTGALSGLGLALGAVSVAAVAGVGIWELWGKSAYNSWKQTQEWGGTVSKTTAKIATDSKAYGDTVKSSMGTSATAMQGAARGSEHSFESLDSELKTVQASAEKTKNSLIDALNQQGGMNSGNLSGDVEKQTTIGKQSQDQNVKNLEANNAKIQAIYKRAAAEHRSTTSAENADIQALNTMSAEQEVDFMGLSGKRREGVLKAINGNINDLNKQQQEKTLDILKSQSTSERNMYSRDAGQLKKLHQDGIISDSDYYKDRSKLTKNYVAEYGSSMAAFAKLTKARELATAKGTGNDHPAETAMVKTVQALQKQYGLSASAAKKFYDQMNNMGSKSAQGVVNVTKRSSDAVKNAAAQWNALKLRDKNGKFTSNSTKVIAGAMKDKDTWNNIKLLIKKGKFDSETRAKVAQAAVDAGKWNSLSFKEQKLLARNQADASVMSAIKSMGIWDDLSPKQQLLLAEAKTGPALVKAMGDVGVWGKLPAKVKKLIAHAKTAADVKKAMSGVAGWNNLPAKLRNLIAHDLASGPAKRAKGSVDRYPTKIKISILVAHDHASGPAGIAKRAVDAFHSGEKVMNLITNIFTHKHKARGTDNFEGGPVMVNDQEGPTFREMIIDPKLGTFVPEGRNVLLNLNRNARVIPAPRTDRLLGGIPQFANGLNVPSDAPVISMTDDIQQSATAGTDTDSTQAIVKLLTQIAAQDPEGMIKALLGKIELSTDISISRTKVAKAMSDVTETQIAKALKRAGGGKSA